MSREVQVRFCESRAVRSRPATHLDSTYRIEREMETRVLCEPELAACLQREGIRLIPHGAPGCAAD